MPMAEDFVPAAALELDDWLSEVGLAPLPDVCVPDDWVAFEVGEEDVDVNPSD